MNEGAPDAPGPTTGFDFVRDPTAFHGRVETRPFESRLLKDNPLGDPHLREVPVYLPPGWDAPGARFPVVHILVGFTGRPHKMLETHPWHPGPVLAYDRAVHAGTLPPAILVMPDAFTRLGGSQYVNSEATGPYQDYLTQEILPWVAETYPADTDRQAVMGKSSGGFGALHLAMAHPHHFRAAASISGDCGFEFLFGAELLAALRGLGPHGGDPQGFLEAFTEKPKLDGDGHAVLNVLAMAACYSPDPTAPSGFRLPVDPETGERIEEVWQQWLRFDPVHAVREHAGSLLSLNKLYLECGEADEFHLQWGLRQLCRTLDELGVPYERGSHEGGHFGLDARYPIALGKLLGALDA